MGTRWCVWLTLLLFYKATAAGAPGEESGPVRLNGILGESITFSPVVPTGTRITNVAWNAKTIIAVVAPGKQVPLNVIDQRYTERLRVPDGNHSLQITGLSQEDTGTYTAQITRQGITEPIFQRFALHVYKRLTESDIKIFPVHNSVRTVNGTCNVTLNCTLQGGGENVTYTWNQTEESTVVTSEASILISYSGVSPVTCTARNPVSSSSKSISPKEVCEGITEQSTVNWKIGAGVFVFVFVGAGLIVLIIKSQREKASQGINSEPRDSEAAADKNTVYAQVGNLPLPHSRTGTPKASPETKKDETKTIYSKVHYPNESPPQTDDEKLSKDGLESMEKSERTIYATVNQPTQTKPAKSTDAADSAVTPKSQGPSEYDKII